MDKNTSEALILHDSFLGETDILGPVFQKGPLGLVGGRARCLWGQDQELEHSSTHWWLCAPLLTCGLWILAVRAHCVPSTGVNQREQRGEEAPLTDEFCLR